MDTTTSSTTSAIEQTILFVGSNPSNSSTCDVAFHMSTQSSKILTGWCVDLQGLKVHINVLNKKTENNRPVTKTEMLEALPRLSDDIRCINPTHIVALGKTAAGALTMLGISHYEMPHPSGLNRLLNDSTFVAEKVKGLIEFCSTKPSTNNSNSNSN